MKVVISLADGYVDKSGNEVWVSRGALKLIEIVDETTGFFEKDDPENQTMWLIAKDVDGVEYPILDWIVTE